MSDDQLSARRARRASAAVRRAPRLEPVADRWIADLAEPVVLQPRPRGEAAGRPALAIIHAQYDRELARAATSAPGERAAAFAEARRLVRTAVALRCGHAAHEVAEIAARVPAEPTLRAL